VAGTVLETVLSQLDMSPAEYFAKLEQSLEDAKSRRLAKVKQSQELDDLVQQEFMAPDLAPISALAENESFSLDDSGAMASGEPARSKAKDRRTRTRPGRPSFEEEDDTETYGLDIPGEEENQFRLAYRRAMRSPASPRRPRER
jgi:hypothetical protein